MASETEVDGGVRIEVVDDPTGEEIAKLRDWLRMDVPRLRVTSVHHPVRPGEMSGGVLAAVQTAALSPEVFAALITALGGWLATRTMSRRTRIRIKIDNREFEYEGPANAKPEEIARQLGSAIGAPRPPHTPPR
jgi:hypothetical protein